MSVELDVGRAQALPSQLDWLAVLVQCAYVPVAYTPTFVRYQTEYFALTDLSRVLTHDGRPVGVWPLGLREDGCGVWVTSNGTEILPPLLAPLPEKVEKRIIADCLRTVQELCEKYGQMQWWSRETVMQGGFSLWHRRIMEHGGRATIDHELFVDLWLPAEKIRANVRKSYRSLIQQGQRQFAVSCGTDIGPLKQLHIEVSGRQTRSDATWQRQQEAVAAGEAFIVYVHDEERLVGGALFCHSRDECYYAVAAEDRDPRYHSIGHVTQMFAIEHMQALGLDWYHLGLRPYAAEEKELSIAHFKEGWATHTFPRVTTNLLRK